MVHLRILEYSQVYHDIILAIRQFTGYSKPFPNPRGQIRPRDTGANGNLDSTFRDSFMDVVNSFLVERKVGVSYFPPIDPVDAIRELQSCRIDSVDSQATENYHDWEPRLIWENPEDEKDIRVYIALLFEALKTNDLPPGANGEPFDLTRGRLVESFDTPECFVCGNASGDNKVECKPSANSEDCNSLISTKVQNVIVNFIDIAMTLQIRLKTINPGKQTFSSSFRIAPFPPHHV